MFIHITRHETSHPHVPIRIHFSQHIGSWETGIQTEIQVSLEQAQTLANELNEFVRSIKAWQAKIPTV